MKAETYIPIDKSCWYWEDGVLKRARDTRVRCVDDGKVVFAEMRLAQRSADGATKRGNPMKPYLGKCGHWHTSRIRVK